MVFVCKKKKTKWKILNEWAEIDCIFDCSHFNFAWICILIKEKKIKQEKIANIFYKIFPNEILFALICIKSSTINKLKWKCKETKKILISPHKSIRKTFWYQNLHIFLFFTLFHMFPVNRNYFWSRTNKDDLIYIAAEWKKRNEKKKKVDEIIKNRKRKSKPNRHTIKQSDRWWNAFDLNEYIDKQYIEENVCVLIAYLHDNHHHGCQWEKGNFGAKWVKDGEWFLSLHFVTFQSRSFFCAADFMLYVANIHPMMNKYVQYKSFEKLFRVILKL